MFCVGVLAPRCATSKARSKATVPHQCLAKSVMSDLMRSARKVPMRSYWQPRGPRPRPRPYLVAHLGCDPCDGADARLALTRGLTDACALAEHLADRGLLIGGHARPAELGPLGDGARQAGIDALADHLALEFREHAQHLKHCFAGWRPRI